MSEMYIIDTGGIGEEENFQKFKFNTSGTPIDFWLGLIINNSAANRAYERQLPGSMSEMTRTLNFFGTMISQRSETI